MKIIHFFADPGYGGSEKYALYLSREAIKNKDETLFLVDREGPLTAILKKDKISYTLTRSQQFGVFRRYFKSYVALQKIVRQFQPDVVHTHFLRENLVAVLLKMMGGKFRLIRTLHRLDRFKGVGFIVTKLLVNRFTDIFIAPSNYAKSIAISKGFRPKKIVVIYNGAPKIMCEDRKNNTIGLLSRLEASKGIREFVTHISPELDLHKVLIAGDGPLEPEIVKIIQKKKLKNIKMLGRVDNLEDFFSKIDILVHPSFNESTLPLSVIESLSAGKKAIVFNIAPVKEFSTKGLFKVEVGNWDALTAKIKKELAAQDNISQQIIEDYEKQFSTKIFFAKTKEIYLKIC